MNRLGESTSPYLLQHAENPVNWWTWSGEAFEEARRRDVPVFLSVGYSACHWCHVMAHESFEDDGIAEYLNEHFVSIKVDREERPDVDAVYMEATVAMTGQGGWPMSCFLTPSGEPFYCGTYFPRDAFRQVLEALVNAWRTKRDEVGGIGRSVVEQLAARRLPGQQGAYDESVLDAAVSGLARDFDVRDAGFGGAPKFPPSMVLDFLLRHHRRTGSEEALSMVEQTCRRMARGGMYDQLAGGFSRYSVDAQWVIPHFEKMLYDNALLIDVYAQWWAITGDSLAHRITTETADFLLAELRTSEGGFASALDADSEGVEGKFYVWTPAELESVLGATDAAWVTELCQVTGTFEHGTSVLQLPNDPHDPNDPQDPDDPDDPQDPGGSERWQRIRTALLEARARRVRPGRDDKVVAAWNGLVITALTRAGVVLGSPAYVEAAVRAAELIRDVHIDAGGRLHRTSRDGKVGDALGVLEDYGAFANACLTLLAVTGDASWYELAGKLLDRVLANFVADGTHRGSGGRPPEGTFFDTDKEADDLIWRPTDPTDNASPSGVSLAAEALTTYAAVSGSERHRAAAEQALAATAMLAKQAPRFAGRGLAVAEATRQGPPEVAVVGGLDERSELVRTAVRYAPWGSPVVAGEPGLAVPLMEGRDRKDGSPAAYVCQRFTCKLPVTSPSALREQLDS